MGANRTLATAKALVMSAFALAMACGDVHRPAEVPAQPDNATGGGSDAAASVPVGRGAGPGMADAGTSRGMSEQPSRAAGTGAGEPSAGAGGAGGQAGRAGQASSGIDASAPADAGRQTKSADAGAPSFAAGQLSFEVTTKPSGDSRYEPENLLAIWVEDDAGEPIKLLGKWAGTMVLSLQVFSQRVAPVLGAGFFNSAGIPDPDTITMATQDVHATRSVTWNMTDARGVVVPDGTYAIAVESADDRDRSALTRVPFVKGRSPVVIELEETSEFGAIRLEYTPPSE